jgi:hypothetical protein
MQGPRTLFRSKDNWFVHHHVYMCACMYVLYVRTHIATRVEIWIALVLTFVSMIILRCVKRFKFSDVPRILFG